MWIVSFTPLPLYSRGRSPRCPLGRRLVGAQSPFGCYRGKEKFASAGNRNPTVQPLAHGYVDWTISTWKEVVVAWFEVLSICLEELRKTRKTLIIILTFSISYTLPSTSELRTMQRYLHSTHFPVHCYTHTLGFSVLISRILVTYL
jgi:hypothetical protein